jgi:hypothetical protein
MEGNLLENWDAAKSLAYTMQSDYLKGNGRLW